MFSKGKEIKSLAADIAAQKFFQKIEPPIQQQGFAFLPAKETCALIEKLGGSPADWNLFTESWNDLGKDKFMADGGRYRRRRYGVFSLKENEIISKPHQPHYQSHDYNPLNGGIERWFDPINEEIKESSALRATLKLVWTLAETFTNRSEIPDSWHAEIHQYRIEANQSEKGHPAPEGLHRDGVDWVFVLMIKRHNVKEGTTSIYDLDKTKKLAEFTLFEPFDAAFVNDHRVYHGVTAIEPENIDEPAARDVLVITLRHE
ncbi:hypothetical protein FAI41_08210 [Acetobacteraceae bacterium]|nr:hypothetical protein FAI41_08210 [Acetobacteraceae bacterium]